MGNAFVVDFNYRWLYHVVQAESCSQGCSFTVQDFMTSSPQYMKKEHDEPNDKKGWTYFYSTENAHEAELLSHLLQKVQKYQLFHWVHDTFDNFYKDKGYETTIETMQEPYYNMLNHLSFMNSLDSWPVNYIPGRNYPIKVYKLDTNRKNLKPCFFVRGYEMHDDTEPWYMYVMLTRNHPDLPQIDFYDFDVRVIGSDEPLSEYISKIHIYDAEQVYQRMRNDYTIANQEYIHQICHLIGSENFRRRLQTYTTWLGCARGEQDSCYGYDHKEQKCKFRCMWNNGIGKHDGEYAYKLFCDAFGKEIGDLVINGKFTRDMWHLMPDFTDRTFVSAYNKFCTDNRLEYYRIKHIFDPNRYVSKGLLYLNEYINGIKTWAANPNSDTVPYLREGQTFNILTNKIRLERMGILPAIKHAMEPHK